MKYKVISKQNPQNRKAPEKFYGTPVWDGRVSIDELSDIIAGRSSLTAGDVANVLRNFLDEVPRLMLMGKAVDLEKFGIFRISFGSYGAANAKDFNTSMIRDVKVVYRASTEINKRVQDGISFERVSEKKSADSGDISDPTA